MNAGKLVNRFSRSRWALLPAAALFLLSGRCVNADPVGDFFKKVGQSISKSFQPQSPPNQTKKQTTKRTSRRQTPSQSNLAGASPTPVEQPPNPGEEEKVPVVTVRRASAVPAEKAKGDMPYAIPVPGHKGMVTSPYSPEGNYVDVSGFAPGSAVRDPFTGKIFLVP